MTQSKSYFRNRLRKTTSLKCWLQFPLWREAPPHHLQALKFTKDYLWFVLDKSIWWGMKNTITLQLTGKTKSCSFLSQNIYKQKMRVTQPHDRPAERLRLFLLSSGCRACSTWATLEKGQSNRHGLRLNPQLSVLIFCSSLDFFSCITRKSGLLVWKNKSRRKWTQHFDSFHSVVDSSPEKPFKWGGWVIYGFIISPHLNITWFRNYCLNL